MNFETLPNGAFRCPDDPGEPGYAVRSQRISITPDEARILQALAYGKNVLEIGTGLGVSTNALALGAKFVVTVDVDPWVQAHVWGDLPGNVLPMRSVEDTSLRFELAFIDGLHTAEAVLADIQTCNTVLDVLNGVYVFHDVEIDRVRETIEAVLGEAPVLLSRNLGWLPNRRIL